MQGPQLSPSLWLCSLHISYSPAWIPGRLTGLTIASFSTAGLPTKQQPPLRQTECLEQMQGFLLQKGVKHTWTKVLGPFRCFYSAVGRAHPGHQSICVPHTCQHGLSPTGLFCSSWECCCLGAHSELGIAAPTEVHSSASGNFSHAKKFCRRETKLLRLTSSHLYFVAEPLSPTLLPPNWGWQNKKCVCPGLQPGVSA